MADDDIRKEILKKVKEYYIKSFPKDRFIPGKTRINYAGRVFNENELINLVDASLDFWLTAGRYTEEFENSLSNFIGVGYCSLVNSGSSANLLAISALTSQKLKDRRLKSGDEVITVAAGFPTTITPIIQNGLVPVFVDIEMETYNVDVEQLERALTKKTKAIILAHTLGNPFDIRIVKEFCDKNNLWLIEDNCDALGSKYKGKYTGTFGDISTCSFYPAHHITMGEGGAVLTDDATLAKIIRSSRDWGRDCWCPPGKDNTCGKRFSQKIGDLPFGYDHKYTYSHLGYNLKVTDMQAAIGVAQLKKLPKFIETRKKNHRMLFKGLKSMKDKIVLPKAQKNSDPSWFGFLITLRDGIGINRNEVVRELETYNIQTRLLFAGNMVRQPAFTFLRRGIDYRLVDSLKNTDKVMNNSFWIGVYPGITETMVDYIVEKIELNLNRG